MGKPILFSPQSAKRIAAVVKAVEGEPVNLSGYRTTPLPANRKGLTPQWFKITSSTEDGSNRRWTYSARKAVKTLAGYSGGWQNDPADTATYTLLNGIEANNTTASTIYGNGVAKANIPYGFDIVAIGSGAVVLAWPVKLADGSTEWWFDEVNQIDGQCGD